MEGPQPFGEPGAREDLVPGGTGDLTCLLPAQATCLADEPEAALDRAGAHFGEFPGEAKSASGSVAGDFVDQTHFAGFGGGKDSAGQRQFDGAAFAESRRNGAKDQKRPEPEPDLGEPECSVGSGHYDVAVRDQARAAGQRGSVDRPYQRLFNAIDGGEELFVERADIRRAGTLLDFGQVHTGAERLALAIEQHGSDGAVPGAGIDGFHEGAAEGGIQGVALFRAVQGESKQAALANALYKFAHIWFDRAEIPVAAATERGDWFHYIRLLRGQTKLSQGAAFAPRGRFRLSPSFAVCPHTFALRHFTDVTRARLVQVSGGSDMLKKLGIPILALGAMLSLAPRPAQARVHFGVYVGPRVVAPPYYYSYDPYYDPYYGYPPTYTYRYYAPAPRYYYVPRYRNFEHERHEWMEHRREFRGRGEHRGWRM